MRQYPYGLATGHEASTAEQLLPESIMRQYPYGLATGYEPLTVFRGEDYGSAYGFGKVIPKPKQRFEDLPPETQKKLLERSKGQRWSEGQSPADTFKGAANFVENTVKTAGKEVGHVVKSIQNAIGDVSKEVGKIPVVGGLLQGVFDLTYHAIMWPAELAIAIVIDGKRIDQAVLDDIKKQVQSVKEVAPYAQMVISVVPGIGPGVSAALSAGLALAEGQPIEEVLKAGLIGAIPGGPLVKAAVTMGVETIQHVAKGEKVDFDTLAQTAGGIASSALGLPIVAKNALMAGIATMGGLVKGQPLDKAVTDGAISALPVSNEIKGAMTEATALTLDLANGKPLDRALFARVDNVVNQLPVGHALRETLKTGISATKKLAEGRKPEQVMMIALQSGIGDSLVSMGANKLPKEVKEAIKSGVAVGTGVVTQARRAEQLVNKIPGKLAESGIQLAKAHPLFQEARKIAASQGATKGFDVATGLIQHQAKAFDVTTVRNNLESASDKLGFDLACATRVGAVTNPKPPGTVTAAAHAGQAITMGMQGYEPAKKQVMMTAVQAVPGAAAGATSAVKQVALARETLIQRILRILGLR